MQSEKDFEMRSFWIRVALNPGTGTLEQTDRDAQVHGRGHGKTAAGWSEAAAS